MPDIQKTYTEETGKNNVIENIVRRLRSQGVISAIQYNGSNWSVYWGLSEWVDNDKQDFKNGHRPKDISLEAISKVIK